MIHAGLSKIEKACSTDRPFKSKFSNSICYNSMQGICFKKGWRAGAGDGVNSACIKRG